MDNSIVLSTGALALVCSYLMQALKRQAWFPFLSTADRNFNGVVAAIVAGVAAFGIHVSFDSHAGVLTITGLTVVGVAHMAWQWLTQWATQEFVYKTAVAPQNLTQVLAGLVQQLNKGGTNAAAK